MRRVRAVKDVSFQVERGDISGFRPKRRGQDHHHQDLTGLIRPTSGTAELFGEAVPSRRAWPESAFCPKTRTSIPT